MKKKIICILLMTLATTTAFSQVAIKSNILYDATTTMNLGAEIGIAPKWSIDISSNYNPWKWNNGMRLRHIAIQPEGRYWFCEKFNGHFVGLHTHWANFNIGNMPNYSVFSQNIQDNRYEGNLWGAGVSYGYQYPVSKHFSVEGVIGLGFARIHKKKFPCAECGTVLKDERYTYWGPTKIAFNVIYIF